MNSNPKMLTTSAMFCAIAYAAVFFCRIPVVAFLKYEPKDVIITIGGLLMGPIVAFLISLVVSVIEMMTISDTGVIGLFMNVVASTTFACSASIIYQKNRTLKGAIYGLLVGWFAMTIVMLLWNYLITPFYMAVPREAVVSMLLPVILPFNLIKGGLNFAIVLLLYKPVVNALRKANLVDGQMAKAGINRAIIALALFVGLSGVLLILVFQGVI